MSDMRVKSQQWGQVYRSQESARATPKQAEQSGVQPGRPDAFVGSGGVREKLSHLLDGGTRASAASTTFVQAQVEPPRPTWNPEAGQAFLNEGETWSPIQVAEQYSWLGAVTRQDGSIYNQSAEEVLANPDANWCATLAWDVLGASLPGWSTQDTRDAAAALYETSSSTSVWEQVGGQALPPEGSAVSLPVGDTGEALNFNALETFTSTEPPSSPMLTSLADIPVGESRAVVMRPLDSNGNADDTTGHWVVVERVSEDEFRIHQSAPGNWVMAGTSWQPGGTFSQTFTGADAAQQVSDCLHRQSQFASSNQGSPGYGLVVLEPTLPEVPARTA